MRYVNVKSIYHYLALLGRVIHYILIVTFPDFIPVKGLFDQSVCLLY